MSSYKGSIYSAHDGKEGAISQELVDAVQEAEKVFECPVWSLIHWEARDKYGALGPEIYEGFLAQLDELRACKDANGIALILDSRGGYLHDSYRIATLLRRSCSTFRVLVPRMAKSSATLLAMGATELYLGPEAELGPVDVQIMDEFERPHAAINEVEALERLRTGAVEQIIYTNEELYDEIKPDSLEALLPSVLSFVGEFMRPMVDKIDAIHYTVQARNLNVAEGYATRLLQKDGEGDLARIIARHLVRNYPSHEFVIGYEEAAEFLDLAKPSDQQQHVLDRLRKVLSQGTDVMIGSLVSAEEQEPAQSDTSASG